VRQYLSLPVTLGVQPKLIQNGKRLIIKALVKLRSMGEQMLHSMLGICPLVTLITKVDGSVGAHKLEI
jgi:hypothetical protein